MVNNPLQENIGDLQPLDEEQGRCEHFRLNVDKGQAPMRVDKYMAIHLEDTSRHRIQLAIKNSYVLVNDKVVKANYVVRPLDVIVNKPAGMVVHPGHGHFSGTLVNALAFHLGISQAPEAEDERMGVLVHRIDKDTSGLLVVAKDDETQMNLAKQFFVHSIERKYIAVVWGNITDDEGTIESFIGRDPSDRLRFKNVPDEDKGKHAVTHYKVLQRYGYITVVECRLETGRTHQIRVHMSSIGHPLFNDERYGGSEIRNGTIFAKYRQFINNCFQICPRQALHAATLGFIHPHTKKEIRFEAPLPEDMQSLIAKWREYTAAKDTLV